MRRIPTPPKDFNVMQHELLTDGPPPEAPETSNLMQLRYRNERFQVDVPDVNYELNKTELTRRVIALAAQFDKMANAIQGLPNRDDHDATVADVFALQQQVQMILDVQKMQAAAMNDLLLVVQVLHRRERAA